jgi:hypothetical protein
MLKITGLGCELAFHHNFFATGAPWILVSHICCLKAETGFLQFKEQVSFKPENV